MKHIKYFEKLAKEAYDLASKYGLKEEKQKIAEEDYKVRQITSFGFLQF